MKTALVTTTVNIPEVLRLYRAYGPDVQMFVATDDKTPDVRELAYDLNFKICSPRQADEDWKCSPLIGRNCIQRRNIATLEALKAGANIIIFCDDDNLPVSCLHFNEFREVLTQPFNGLMVGKSGQWVDVGNLLTPPVRQRGIWWHTPNPPHVGFCLGAKVGVTQGVCIGDPDINAYERMTNAPIVHNVSQLLEAGVVVEPTAYTVWNSQNTAFVRELAPCMLLCPQFGRCDDIYMSLIANTIMLHTGYYVHFGKPYCWQTRNEHHLIKDAAAENWGLEHIGQFMTWLDGLTLTGSVLDMVRLIWASIGVDLEWMPPGVSELGLAWCADVESVL